MSSIRVEYGQVIDADPEAIYNVLADYRVGHRAILPPQFTGLTVEQGGYGAGTLVLTTLRVFGRDYTFHQAVTEPEPGRLLVETEVNTGQWSSFTLEPLNGGTQTRVTIKSEFPVQNALMAFLMGLGQKPMTIRMYKEELNNLAEYVRVHAAQPAPLGV